MGFLSEIEEEKIPEVKISAEKKKSVVMPAAHPASMIPISRPQPCPLCQCPAFWVSVYDSLHAHCRVCETPPVSSVVQGHCNVILSLSESQGTNRTYEWDDSGSDPTTAQPTTGVVDDAAWETVTTAAGEVIDTVKGWRDICNRNYSQWMVVAVRNGVKFADDLLAFK